LPIIVFAILATRAVAQTTKPVAQIDHVLIISIDGLRPDVLLRADTPRIHQLCASGSFTFWARTTPASVTLPTHVSILTGVSPESHGVTWNADLPLSKPIYPNAPTLFELAHKAGYTTAMAVGKRKIAIVDKPRTIDWKYVPGQEKSEDPDVTSQALRIMHDHQPNVMFVHLPTVDNVGHAVGWGSPQQLEAVAGADRCVGQLLDALDEFKLRDSTLVIVTSDHGGAGRTHGAEDPRSRTIPWIASGPGIRKGLDLTLLGRDVDIDTYDTFATTCAILGIPVQRKINGKFVWQILEDRELVQPATAPSQAPAMQP